MVIKLCAGLIKCLLSEMRINIFPLLCTLVFLFYFPLFFHFASFSCFPVCVLSWGIKLHNYL